MANVVCVWELGENLGHLSNLKAIAKQALVKGHDVWVVAKDLARAHIVFNEMTVRFLQAPYQRKSRAIVAEDMQCYSQLIANYCYETKADFANYLSAWRNLFDLLQPEIVFYDHSPTALAASWGQRFKKVVVGSGFTLPPTETALFGVFPSTGSAPFDLERIRDAEFKLLADLESCLRPYTDVGIRQVADIYRQADHIVRLTIPELDHFGARPRGGYVGAWPSHGSALPEWDDNARFKVFAYLQAFKGLPKLLEALVVQGAEVAIYCPTLSPQDQQKLTGPRVQFLSEPADLMCLADDLDAAVTHGNHDTSLWLTLKGVPLLTIPRHQEQLFFAQAHTKHQLGVMAYQDQKDYLFETKSLLSDSSYRENSKALGKKYASQLEGLPQRKIDEILSGI